MKKFFLSVAMFAALFGAMSAAQAEPIRIVCFGGSNTFGKNLARSAAYPAQLQALLKARGRDVVVVNEGTNGQTTAEELSKVDRSVPAGTDIVIFQPGGNDKQKGGADTRANIKAIVQKLQDRQIAVLFSGGKSKQKAVAQFNVPVVDEINKLAPDDLQSDGQHLTEKGYRRAAEQMLPAVEQLIAQVKQR